MWDLKEYRFATSPSEAVALMRKGPGRGAYIAGGTDMFLYPPTCDFVVDVNKAGISDIARTPGGEVFIGAAATLHNMAGSDLLTDYAGGVLGRVAALCGNRPVRTTATVGGNLCNALPSADMAPVLLALDAVCFVADEDNQESLPLTDFFVGPRRTVLDDRLLVGLGLPAEAAGRRCFCKKLTRSAEDIALVQVAVGLDIENGIVEQARIALGAVAPVPLRASLAEAMITGRPVSDITGDLILDAALVAAGEASPIDDHRASAEYRREMVRVLTKRLLCRALTPDDGSTDPCGGVDASGEDEGGAV